jgi:hypothetical protein
VKTITVCYLNYSSLKKSYEKARADGRDVFTWQAPEDDSVHAILTDYAKYFLTYLEQRLGIKE